MIILTIISILLLIGIDQLTKIWAVARLENQMPIKLWEGVFHFEFIRNEGAAWGIFSGKQGFLIVLTSVIIIAMIVYIFKLPKTKWGNIGRVAFVLVISGAVGNLIDRVLYGNVRDFLYFKLIDFPIFNVADILVVVGVGLLLLTLLCGDLDHDNEKKEDV